LVGRADGSVDQCEVGDGRVLFEDLRVDDREQHDVDALGRLGAKDDLRSRSTVP
jgi:hypothetical protein